MRRLGAKNMRRKFKWKNKGENEMDANTLNSIERYCSISESLKQSCSQVKLIRSGKLPKKTWKELREDLKKIKSGDE
jgi:hypothetical protein